MGQASSKKDGIIKTKVIAVGRLSLVRKKTSERREEHAELMRRREEAISVFDDSVGEISNEDITSLPLKNCDTYTEGFSVTGSSNELRKWSHPPALTLNDFKKVTRKDTLSEMTLPFDIPYVSTDKTEVSEHCHVCEVYTGHEVYPCRICSKAFHKSCLQKLGHCLNAAEVALLHSAKSPTGWTCYLCHDLSNLLTEEELSALMESFARHGIQPGGPVSKEEFLQFSAESHKSRSNCSLTDEEKADENFKFNQLDKHQKDCIPWSDFMNYQSVVVLQSRHKSFLVPLLTSREQDIARKVFRLFDENYDGQITPTEATKAMSSWCTLFYSRTGSYTGYELFFDNDDDRLQMQLKQRLSFTMATEDEEASSITWDDFIREQAIYVIATRPNESRIPLKSKEWVQNMQVQFARYEIQRKNSLRPSEIEPDDNRSDTSGLSSASIEQINILH